LKNCFIFDFEQHLNEPLLLCFLVAPARPPPRKPGGGFGLKPPIPQAERAKTPLPKEVPKPKPGNHLILVVEEARLSYF